MRVEGVVGGIGGDFVVTVVFIGVDDSVGTPFDDEVALLEERLFFRECQRFNSGDDCVRDGEDLPAMA
jgi:hypothetical protein